MSKNVIRLCGWCSGAPLDAEGPQHAHDRCPVTRDGGSGQVSCLCGEGNHVLSAEVFEAMAASNNTTVEAVKLALGATKPKRTRNLSDAQREALRARMDVVRAARKASLQDVAGVC